MKNAVFSEGGGNDTTADAAAAAASDPSPAYKDANSTDALLPGDGAAGGGDGADHSGKELGDPPP